MPNKKYFTTEELLLWGISFLTINVSFLIFDRERGDNANLTLPCSNLWTAEWRKWKIVSFLIIQNKITALDSIGSCFSFFVSVWKLSLFENVINTDIIQLWKCHKNFIRERLSFCFNVTVFPLRNADFIRNLLLSHVMILSEIPYPVIHINHRKYFIIDKYYLLTFR